MKRVTLLIVAVVACVIVPWKTDAQQRRAGWSGGRQMASGGPGLQGIGFQRGQLGRRSGSGPLGNSGNVPLGNSGSVTDQDSKIDLLRMWEEEKLARDVYTRLADSTGMRLFQNISRSEIQHMQALARVMQTRGGAANQLNDQPGVFRFPDYQELYQTLVAEGSRGPLEAVKVGAKIEEMDIADLQRMIASTRDAQLSGVLQHLLSGSYNHLRAFHSQLTALGATYTPQFLTQQQYDQIVGGQSGQRGPRGFRGSDNPQGAGGVRGAGPSGSRGSGQGRGRRGR